MSSGNTPPSTARIPLQRRTIALSIILTLTIFGAAAIKLIFAQEPDAVDRRAILEPANSVPAIASPSAYLLTDQTTAGVANVSPVQVTAGAAIDVVQTPATQTEEYRVYVPRTVVQTVVDPSDPRKTYQQSSTVYESETRVRTSPQIASSIAQSMRTRTRVSGATLKLAEQLRKQPEQDRDAALVGKLRDALADEFEERHSSQVDRLKTILAEIQRTEQILQQREEQREDIVERRLTELLGGSDQLGWEYDPQLPTADNSAQFRGNSQLALPPLRPRPPTAPQTSGALPEADSSATRLGIASLFDENGTADAKQALPKLNAPVAATGSENPRLLPGTSGVPGSSSLQAVDDIVSLGFRWRGLIQQSDQAQKLLPKGAISKAEVASLQNSLDAAKLQWQFKMQELESQVKTAELELQIAEEELAIATELKESLRDATPESRRGVLEARKALSICLLNIERLHGKFVWAKTFQRELLQAETTTEEELDKAEDAPPELDTTTELEQLNDDSVSETIEAGVTIPGSQIYDVN